MSSRRTLPVGRPATIACCLIVLVAALLLPFARSAQASYYKMVYCAAGNNAPGLTTQTNTTSLLSPNGIFIFQDQCDSPNYPAGTNSFLRLVENQESGNAGVGAFGRMYWTVPTEGTISIAAAGGYTREPNSFNQGWRGRFWAEGWDGSANNILMQGSGVENGSCGGVCWNTTSSFASHLWPFGSYGSYRSFSFEMTCVNQNGCDRSGFNAVDANSMVLTLDDFSPPSASFRGPQPLISGQWVKGTQNVNWIDGDRGSGLRWERLRIDGADKFVFDYRGACDLGANGATGEFARVFSPCPTGIEFNRGTTIDTASLADGTHTMSACVQDYAQSVGLNGTGGEDCEPVEIKTDNHPPGAPEGLKIRSANPNRYEEHVAAEWRLPADPGSPIAKVHYDIVNAAGEVVVPEKTQSANSPTNLDNVVGPAQPGDYRLQVWLEDTVGFTGPPATVAIPRDTTPPAAPQDLSVTAPLTTRSAEGFDVHWRNITDSGAPIDAAHYQVLNGAGQVVVSTQDVRGENPQAIQSLVTPKEAGGYTLRLWLSDAEGNVGAPVSAPLAYECQRSDVAGGNALTAGFGESSERVTTVPQGRGSGFNGSLRGSGDPIPGAALCVLSRVVTDKGREFLGTAMTSRDGSYAFPVQPGPSREVVAMYRGDHREVEAEATTRTRVKPVFKVRPHVVHNKHKACFYGLIPGPHNDNVVVVFQVKDGKGWRAFRRYRTRSNGHYEACYRFTQTRALTIYPMRAQVREQVGYPFEQGNSNVLRLKVMP